MHWLNEVLAVPALGVRINTEFKTMLSWQSCLSDFFDHLTDEGHNLNISEIELWGYEIQFPDSGFAFNITHNKILGRFSYLVSQSQQPGGLPELRVPSVKTYVEILEELEKYFFKILYFIKDLKNIEYYRIGIVADVGLEKDALPPGLIAWRQHLGKPWEHGIIKSDTKLLAKLYEDSTYYDQCHHFLAYDETEVDKIGLTFKIDWQRTFTSPIVFKERDLVNNITICRETALEYFEKFGEGDMNYD